MIRRFIDAKQFQRLRKIKQLGTIEYSGWPKTSYSRLDHSLGVSCLARQMASHLKAQQPQLNITDRDLNCVEIAGLCHDLGHGPWSHLWDGLFMPAVLKWNHEEGSELLFDALVQEQNIPIPLEDQLFIKALIAGDHSRTPYEKGFLFDIVANNRNGFDVDKFDYIHRDNHLTGTPLLSPLSCVIQSARVIDDQICYNVNEARYIYDLAASRFRLHKLVYNNITSKAVNYMIIDALLVANPVMKIAERVFDAHEYLTLTDEIMPQIESSTDPSLTASRAVFKRIHDREYYECISSKIIEWPLRNIFAKHVTGSRILEASRKLTTSGSKEFELLKGVEDSGVVVDFSTVHHGMKEKNPMSFVRFYSTENFNVSFNVDHSVYSNTPLPNCFAEVILTVYSKNHRTSKLLEAGCHEVLQGVETYIASS